MSDEDEGIFTLPTAPSGRWEELTPNERGWIEFIRVVSCGSDPQLTLPRLDALTALLDPERGTG